MCVGFWNKPVNNWFVKKKSLNFLSLSLSTSQHPASCHVQHNLYMSIRYCAEYSKHVVNIVVYVRSRWLPLQIYLIGKNKKYNLTKIITSVREWRHDGKRMYEFIVCYCSAMDRSDPLKGDVRRNGQREVGTGLLHANWENRGLWKEIKEFDTCAIFECSILWSRRLDIVFREYKNREP